jgi:hypothetical protein
MTISMVVSPYGSLNRTVPRHFFPDELVVCERYTVGHRATFVRQSTVCIPLCISYPLQERKDYVRMDHNWSSVCSHLGCNH